MERKSYLQFSMKGEEPFTSESPSAQTMLPASRFSLHLPPPPPLPTFPSSPTDSSPGGQRELPNSPVSPESWSWGSLWWEQEREKCGWWKAEGSCQPWPWCWEPWVSRGVQDEEKGTQGCKMLWSCSLSLGTAREAVWACLGWDMGRGRLGCSWVIPCIGASLSAQRGKKGVRNVEGDINVMKGGMLGGMQPWQ